MDRRQGESLDRYITGNYGEDQFRHHEEDLTEPTYTREFWEAALELASVGSKQCEECHGYTILKGIGRRTVRVVLIPEGWPTQGKLRLMCTTCYPDKRDKTLSRKAILAKIAELPFPKSEESKSANG